MELVDMIGKLIEAKKKLQKEEENCNELGVVFSVEEKILRLIDKALQNSTEDAR